MENLQKENLQNLQDLQSLLQNWAVKKDRVYYERITFRIPSPVRKALEERAKAQGITLSDLIRIYIWLGLQQECKQEILDDRK
jgi:predicted DNA binding CopG/RHH family protein